MIVIQCRSSIDLSSHSYSRRIRPSTTSTRHRRRSTSRRAHKLSHRRAVRESMTDRPPNTTISCPCPSPRSSNQPSTITGRRPATTENSQPEYNTPSVIHIIIVIIIAQAAEIIIIIGRRQFSSVTRSLRVGPSLSVQGQQDDDVPTSTTFGMYFTVFHGPTKNRLCPISFTTQNE